MKSVIKFLWVAAYIVIILVVGDQRALTYTDTPSSIIWMTGDQNQCAGTTVQFSVGAVNAQDYEWRKNGVDLVNGGNISGVNSPTLTISNVSAADAGDYGVEVSNGYGDAWSSSHLSVTADPPVITNQPVSVALLLGANATQVQQFQSSDGVYVGGNSASFTVAATGCQPMSYQWKKNGVNLADGGHIAGAHSATLHINPASMADAGTYMVVVTNAAGTVSSTVVSLHVCQFVTSSEDKILGYQYSDINGGTATIHFHFGSPTTISGLNIYGNLFLDQTGQTDTGVLLNTGSMRIPMYCQVYASAIPDPRTQIGLTSIFFRSIDKFYCPSPTSSTDYTVVLRSLSVATPPSRIYPFVPGRNYFFQSDRLSFTTLRGDILISLFQTVSSTNWDCQGPTPLPSVTFTPDSGATPLDVQLSVPGYPSAQIYYTLNGSTPTRSSSLYSGSIHLSAATTVKAFAALNGYPDGPVSSVSYSANPKLPAVDFDPITRIPGIQLFSLTLPTDATMSVPGYPNAQIHYTVNGTTPFGFSPLYTGPLHITAPTTIKAMAIQSGFANGPVTVAQYGLVVSIDTHPVQIVEQPLAQTVVVGSDATLEVQVTGDQPMNYQWQFNGVDLTDTGNLSGSHSSILHLTAAQLSNSGGYSVKVWNWVNQVQSATVPLVVESPKAPIITEQPQDKVVAQGESVTFAVSVTGTAPFTYQWFRNGSQISGTEATFSSYTIPSAPFTAVGYEDVYRVEIHNAAGSATSGNAKLYIRDSGPTVSVSPDTATVNAGDSISFNSTVQSHSGVTYQWQFNGKDIFGATASFLKLSHVELGNRGDYAVIVKNDQGVQTATATLTVNCVQNPLGNCNPYFTEVNHGNPLLIPAQRGTYAFSMETLLPPNSDATNVTRFIVTNVDSGTLLINGESFGADNCTIGPADWVTWVPPVVADNPPKPAFAIFASDGTHDTGVSPGPVDIWIENKSKTKLFAWGSNLGGQVGNGRYSGLMTPTSVIGVGLDWQANIGVIPKDPRWQPMTYRFESYPQAVLDIPAVVSVISDGSDLGLSSAVTSDGTVWQWGYDQSLLLGAPFLTGFDVTRDTQGTYWPNNIWRWGTPFPTDWTPAYTAHFESPTPRIYQAPRRDLGQEAFVGATKIVRPLNYEGPPDYQGSCRIALKDDGTLWSWGLSSSALGRMPSTDDDGVTSLAYVYGAAPRRIELEGNDLSGVTDGRKVLDVVAGWSGMLALCKDNTVWWWGDNRFSSYFLPDGTADTWAFDLKDGSWISDGRVVWPLSRIGDSARVELWKPTHLTALDAITNDSPIIQIAAGYNNFIALRQDGKIFEFGHVPHLDPSGVAEYERSSSPDAMKMVYSAAPLPVAGLPGDPGIPGKIVAVAAGRDFGVALSDSGHVWVWGYYYWFTDFLTVEEGIAQGVLPGYLSPQEIDPKLLSGVVKIAIGDPLSPYILALDKQGRVFGWGYNDWWRGTLGNNGFVFSQPVRIQGVEGVTDIFTSTGNAFAIGVEEDVNRIVLSATPGDQQVMLTWQNCPAGATQYKVYRSTDRYDNYSLIATVNETDFTDDGHENSGPGLSNGTAYYYKVAALVSGVETEMSWEQMATPEPLPLAITSGNIQAVGQCRGIQLTWSAPANATDCQLKKYRILRSTSSTGPFIALTECPADTLQYFDNTAAANPYYYQVIPVNDSGQPASNPTIGPVTVNSSSCAPAPYIASNWKAYFWFQQISQNDPVLGTSDTATLRWAADPAHQWGTTPTAFRIHYRYLYHGMPFGSIYSLDVSRADAEAANSNGGASNDSGQPSSVYSFTWYTSGMPIYASVSAIVNGQEGESSIEVGPVAVGANSIQWSGILSAKPGYHQVYLEWPDNENLCTYTVLRTATRPGKTPQEWSAATWDTLSADIPVPRYWDTNLTDALPTTTFASSDINNDTLAALVASFSDQNNLVSAALFGRWTSSEQGEINSGISAARMAQLLNEAMAGAVLLTDTEFQTVDLTSVPGGGNAFTPKTKELFDSRSTLSVANKYVLNRLIVEEAYSSYGYAHGTDGWVKTVQAFNYYLVQATECGDVAPIYSEWVQARRDDDASAPDPNLGLKISASPYNGMVEVDWNLITAFTGVVAGGSPLSLASTPLLVISAKRYHGGTLVAEGILGRDFTVDQVAKTITIPTGSDLVCQSGDSVLVYFAPLSSDSNWQFLLERKENTAGAAYQRITEAGFGLAYVDQNVVNGQEYIYRINATDGKFNRWQAESSPVMPETGNSLSLSAKPGNTYVDLAWPPLRAVQFTVEHSLSSNTGFEVVTSLTGDNAYQNPANTFRHLKVQNNVDHYYKVIVKTPIGLEIESPVVKVHPSSALPLLPPSGIKATQVQDSSGRKFLLTWNAQEGAGKFQVFVREGSSLTLIYEGSSPRCYYILPPDVQAKLDSGLLKSIDFQFAIRSVNLAGVGGDVNEKAATWTEGSLSDAPNEDNNLVHLKVAGQILNALTLLEFTGPTNLTLSVDTSLPNVKSVSFYDGDNLLGTTGQGETEFLWCHVAGGGHWLSARVEVSDPSLTTGSTYAIYNTPSPDTDGQENVHVTIQPELSAFQTSITDLQLPAPGLPITLSRSYTSRSTSKDDRGLAVGWSANWLTPSVTVSSGLGEGWVGATSKLLSTSYCFFTESSPHLITVNLPDGESVFFQPMIDTAPATIPAAYESDVSDFDMKLQPFNVDAGKLSGINEVSLFSPSDILLGGWTAANWNGKTVTFHGSFGPYTYNAPDGTEYTFEQVALGHPLTYLLTLVKDRNGNTLKYHYDTNTNLDSIAHSSGRKVTLNYSTANQIWVSDSIAGTHPVLKYIFDDRDGQAGKLLEVDRLVDQAGSGTYEPTFYDYGTTTFPAEPQLGHDHQITANAGRLTDIYDARRIRMLHNEYHYDATERTGDVLSQTDAAGRTTTVDLDPDNNLTVSTSWTDENGVHSHTAEVQHDDSGAVSSVAQPSDDNGGRQTSSTLVYDERGRLVAQTDANNKSKTIGYDEKNRPTSQTDENGSTTTITPDDDHFGQPGITEDAEHHQTIYIYDPQGNPLDIKDSAGTETTFTYLKPVTGSGYALGTRTGSERRAVVPFTIVTEYAYNGDDTADNSSSNGDIKSTTEKWVQPVNGVDNTIGTPVTTYFEYDANGNRIAEVKSHTVSAGPPAIVEYVRTENTYDALNRVTYTQIKTNSTSGAPPTLSQWATAHVATHTQTTYNHLGKQASATDGYNRTTFYLYDVSGNLIETKSPDNTVTRTTYDEQNRAVCVQDRAVPSSDVTVGPGTKTTYDAVGRVAKIERLTSITLTKSSTTAFVSNGTVPTQYTMTASSPGDVLTTTRTFYDSVGRAKYSIDAYNVTTEYTYDAGGRRVSSKVYRSKSGASYAYSGSGVPAPANSAFVATFYAYDANGNQTSVTSGITSFDSNGHPVDGQTTTFAYDAANRCTRTTFPATGPSGPAYRSTDYDDLGRSIREVDENRVAKAFTYDFRGLVTSVTVGVGTAQAATTKYGYDELGNLVKQIDQNNHTTTFSCDALGRRTSRTLPDGKTESVTYDDSTTVLPNKTVTDFNQRETHFSFDNMDRLVSKHLPAVGDFAATTVTYDYDAAGHPADVVQSGGVNRTVRYAYDAIGRLRVKDTPEGTLTYDYDNSGSVTYISSLYVYSGWAGDGDPPSRFEDLGGPYGESDTRSEWDYYYDGLGHLSQVCDDQVNGNLNYSYDVLGNLAETHYGNNITTTYSYNERNWLRRVRTWNSGSGPTSLVANFDYDQTGEGVNPTAPSNWADRLLSATGQRRRAVEHYGSVQRTVDYDYDPLQRLTRESISGAQTAVVAYDGAGTGLGYDPVGNRQSRQLTSGSLSGVSAYTGDAFDSRDRLTRSGFSYDDNGNTTGSASGVTDYYDAENHLIKRTQSGQPDIVMTYDADGNRVSKSVGGVTTTYLIDDRNPTGYAQVMEERDGNGIMTAGYMYGLSLAARFGYAPVSQGLSSVYYYGYDGLGSVRYLTDLVGNLTDTYTYDAFGIQIASTGTTSNSYRYTGQQWDADLGMYYLRARYYKPDSGRFWTMDTFEGSQFDPLSLHKYYYCQENPANGFDPSGHSLVSLSISMAWRGAIAGASLGTISAAFTYAKTGSMMAAAQSGLTTFSTVFLGTICPVGGIAMGATSIFSMGVEAWADGGMSRSDAAEIVTMIAASITLHASFSRFGPGFGNLGDGPTLTQPVRFSNGKLADMKNVFNFIITDDGKAVIGPKGQGHVELSRGATVLAAGQVKIINGVVKVINNQSGHYRPAGPLPGMFAIRSLTVRGLDTSEATYADKTFDLPRPIKIDGLEEWGKTAITAGDALSGDNDD